MKHYKEIEAKFIVDSLEPYHEKLRQLGAVLLYDVVEHNEYFDTEDDALEKKGMILRLRKENKITVTLKANKEIKDGMKIYDEYETEVKDFSVIKTIFLSLGLEDYFMIEKHRITYLLNDTYIMLDKMPFGYVVEVEGQPHLVKKIVKDLGLSLDHTTTHGNYYHWKKLLKDYQLGWMNATFQNAKHHKIGIYGKGRQDT